MSRSELKQLEARRKPVRGRVTRSHNTRDDYQNLTPMQRDAEKSHLEYFQKDLLMLDEKVQELKFPVSGGYAEADFDKELDDCISYMDKIRECLVVLQNLDSATKVQPNKGTARTLLRQPTAPLPSFTGKEGDDFCKFIKEFELTTSSYDYPDRDLLLLLSQQVSGKAKIILNSLESDKQTFQEAKDLLVSAFALPEQRKFTSIKQLSEVMFEEPYEYFSKCKMLCEAVKSLKIKEKDFLQYFIWKGMNKRFQDHLVTICGKNHPTIDEIMNNYFTALERYEKDKPNKLKGTDSVHKPFSSSRFKKSSVAAAVKVDNRQSTFVCSLCQKAHIEPCNHSLGNCTAFPTASGKLEKIQQYNGCIKCGRLGHKADKCSACRRPCTYCNGAHFDFLCTKQPNSKNISQAKRSEAVSKVTNTGIVLLSESNSESALPTFSLFIKERLQRALYDRGSQSSFVSSRVAGRLRTVQSNVHLTVCGFNQTQDYLTRIVEVPIRFGIDGDECNIHALVVPSIKVDLQLPQVGQVVEHFQQKGYTLADAYLPFSDRVNNIDFVLGSDASRLLLTKDVPFGDHSLYMDSSVGVLLVGKIMNMISDLPHLPSYKVEHTTPVTDSPSAGMSIMAENRDSYNTSAFFLSHLASSNNEDLIDLDYKPLVNDQFNVVNEKGKLIAARVQNATEQILESDYYRILEYDVNKYNDEDHELNSKLVNYTVNNMSRNAEGRIIVPLLWNGKVLNKLGNNRHLAENILRTNFKKLKKNGLLEMVDQTFREQSELGIIEKITNVEEYIKEYPDHSYLPHMSIFKPDNDTTKCRVVFLSNLCDSSKSKLSLSHNQTMYSGPSLNHKLSSALLQLRFDSHLLTYDLRKAFNQLALDELDQSKLLFLWYNNVSRKDFSLCVYKNVRLSFGLRCSPFLLMISMFYILVLEAVNDPDEVGKLKKLMYSLLYMDNGAITASSSEELSWAYSKLQDIFSPFKFEVQKLITNDLGLQNHVDNVSGVVTDENTKLFGIRWDRKKDSLCTKPIALDIDASTKRSVLRSIASQFDVYNFNLPMLNRARLFMHSLQCTKGLGWDEKLSNDLLKEWKNIVKQANASPVLEVPRYVGPRTGQYELYTFTDASHSMYGTVSYLFHVQSGTLSFLSAKNRMIGNQLKDKSIPSLELNAISLGVENSMEIYNDLSGTSCLCPINITKLYLFTDSACCLNWLTSATRRLDKLQKLSVFVNNRILAIQRLCDKTPVQFGFISGNRNPADCVTRSISYGQLIKTNYITGPDITSLHEHCAIDDSLRVMVPCPEHVSTDTVVHKASINVANAEYECPSVSLLDPNDFSSYHRLVRLHFKVAKCFSKWKNKVDLPSTHVSLLNAHRQVISSEQRKYFPEVFGYFASSNPSLSACPDIMTRMNLFIDNYGIIRVKSKFKKWYPTNTEFPILLPHDSSLTRIVILDIHDMLSHSGCYSVLAELRKKFFIPKCYSTVKKALQACTHCRRFNARTIKLNQNSYRDFRADPSKVPFSNVFIDHLGPFYVHKDKGKEKVWLLIVTCLWTRGINLKICHDLTLREFLRSFQLHSFDFGFPSVCISDLGSQLTAGINVMKQHLSDPEVQDYLTANNIKHLSFQQYFKGCNELGSVVEICVKMIKRLIQGSIKNNVVSYHDFEFLICLVVHLANRRPISFKESLRNVTDDLIPEPITPELLIKGYETVSLNIIPELHDNFSIDSDWDRATEATHIRDEYHKLRKIRSKLFDLYQSEFITKLMHQAVDRSDRYKPVHHKSLAVGDIVLIKETNMKPNQFPMAIVKTVIVNDLGEVTGAVLFKGRTRETVKRHVSSLIPLLRASDENDCFLDQNPTHLDDLSMPDMEEVLKKFGITFPPVSESSSRPPRAAALKSRKLTRDLLKVP